MVGEVVAVSRAALDELASILMVWEAGAVSTDECPLMGAAILTDK